MRWDHLEAVTQAENNLYSDVVLGFRTGQTHCKRGHEFTPENTYVYGDGWRMCRTCTRIRHAEARAKARQEAPTVGGREGNP